MMTQRGEVTAAAKPKPARGRCPCHGAQTSRTFRKKLSFKQTHELKTLNAEIERLQAEIKKCEAVLAEPNLYSRDSKTFTNVSQALAAAQAKLGTAEERWLELEMLREG